MQCRVLGPVELVVAGEGVALTSAQRTILAVLLVNPGGITDTGRLLEALWPDAGPLGARKALHNHIARLRRALDRTADGEPGLLMTEGQGYRLDLSAHELDAHRFETLLAEARVTDDPHRVVALLDRALGLWRGPAYGQLAAHELIRAEAVRLDELRAGAHADRIDAWLRLGFHAQAIADLERTVTAEPLRERPHGQLMLALYRAGRTADSLATFHRIEGRLDEELGVRPAPELERLHERILRRDPVLDAVAGTPFSGSQGRHGPPEARSPGASAVGDRMPRGGPVEGKRPGVLGREADVVAVAELVSASGLVTLTGPGGVGKTRLAEAVGDRIAGRLEDGVVVVGLAPVRAVAALDHAVAGALGVTAGGGLRDRIVSALGGRRLLLIVDNCEHLLPEVGELIEDLLRRCPALTMLATSRERLAVEGESLYPVPPLAVPAATEDAEPDVLAHNPAVRLFCQRATAARPGFSLTAANAPAVVDICRRLDGVPLALELAGARMSAMSVAELAARLHDRFDVLGGGPRREGGRHRTLAEVVAWSYGLLEPSEALLFDRLSVFAGGFTLEAAEHVCGDSQRLASDEVAAWLAELVDKSMVLHSEERYRVLETVRAYGHTNLIQRGEADRVHRAHARVFAALVEQASSAARGSGGGQWLQALRREFDNLRAAHRWAMSIGDADLALRLCAPLAEDGAWWLGDEVAAWAEEATSLPGARGHPLQPLAYGAAATGAVHRGELAHGRELARLGLEAAPDPDDPRRPAAMRALSIAAIFEGHFPDSERIETEILRHAEATGDAYRTVFVHIARAMHALYGSDRAAPAAHVHAQRACAEADTLGNPQARAFAYSIRGEALVAHDPEAARRSLETGLSLARSIPMQSTEAMALLASSTLLAEHGEVTAALDALGDVVRLWRRAGDWAHQWTTLRNLVFLLARSGHDEAAVVLVGAIDTTSTAAPVYGVDAERMRRVTTGLRARLGEERYERSRGTGARMRDDEAVTYALDEIDRARAEAPQRGSASPSNGAEASV